MNKRTLISIACVLAASLSTPAFAENSESETPPDESALARTVNPAPEQVKKFIAYLENLDRRYPDSGKIDVGRFLAVEGESAAMAYCAASGFDGPCTIEVKDGQEQFVAVGAGDVDASTSLRGPWWKWVGSHLFNIGVIPESNSCPQGYSWVEIHMDDEDRRNANERSGWIGAITSTNNTTYRFCKVDTVASLAYRPLPFEGEQYDYAVLNMGLLCPSGARRVMRVEENELWHNANSSSGDIFPNFRIYNTWFTSYCHFDGAASSFLGHMKAFPRLGFAHGVFAPQAMPSPYALSHGAIFQDDEDTLNWNAWFFGSGDQVMNGGRNTWRGLIKVE